MSRPRFAFVIVLISFLLLAHGARAGINFTGAELTNVSPRPEFMAAGDLNGDNLTDVVVVSTASKEVNTYLADNTQPSHFAPARVVRFGQQLRNLAIGDLNNDGRADVVVADPASDAVWILIGVGDGTYLQARQLTVPNSIYPAAVALANFDDTGNLDIAVADSRLAKVFILLNNNDNPPVFRRGGDFAVGEEPTEIKAADLNQDGHPDIITLDLGGPAVKEVAVALWKRVSQTFPEFEDSQRYTVGEKPGDLVVGDFNNDQKPDIAMINKQRGGDGNGEIDVLLNRGGGIFDPPLVNPVPCPFFTGGSPCRSLALATGDFDRNGNMDLVVALADPRRSRGSASSEADAMQVFGGNGNGSFVPGGVFSTQKVPISIAVGDITGDGSLDVAIANQRTLDLQAFINTSSPGTKENSDTCLLGDECLSNRCINGICCASTCDPQNNEVCNITGREGTCIPIPPIPMECENPDPACPADRTFCIDGFCCDEECTGGRCDVDGVIGVCIPGIPVGEPCSGDDRECTTRFCSDNFVCCNEPCDGGFCEEGTGNCHALLPNGDQCNINEECESSVCDVFDGICCNRACDPNDEVCFPGEGVCRPTDYTPSPRPGTPTATRTPTPRQTPGGNGEDCHQGGDCNTGICENEVCCATQCDDNHHCEKGTGVCVEGPVPMSPTATLVPTPLPTVTPEDPCANVTCPSGQQCLNGFCANPGSGGGCSTGGSDPSPGNWVVLGLLPFGLWAGRRWQLRRVRVRTRQR